MTDAAQPLSANLPPGTAPAIAAPAIAPPLIAEPLIAAPPINPPPLASPMAVMPVAVVPVDATTNPAPLPVESFAPAVRFCRICGTAWDPLAGGCDACFRRVAAAPGHDRARQQYDVERRSIFSSVWLYFALLAVSIVTMIVIAVARGHALGSITIAQLAMSLIIAGWAITQRGLLRGAFTLPRSGWLALAVPVGVVTYAFAHGVLWVLHAQLRVPILNAAADYKYLPHGVALAVLGVCAQPAIFEELAFRGIILPSLRRAITTFEAITVTALMFGILHLTFLSMPHLVALGWMAGWLRTRSGSLYPAMVLHFTHNALVLASDWHGGSLLW